MDSRSQLTMIAGCDINRGMRRRELNFFLAGAAVIGVLWGGFRVGRSIIHIGHEYHGASSQTGGTSARTGTNTGGGFNSLSLDVRIALLALAALVVATILGAVIGTVRRHREAKRRRERYYY
jgi:hypothetical protein